MRASLMLLRSAFLVAALAAPLAAQRVAAPAATPAEIPFPAGGGYHIGPGEVDFIAARSFANKTVKNAPYSAEIVNEMVQTLGDGNRIVQKSSSQVYRDSDGRTRRERTLGAIGPWASTGEGQKLVTIEDPVAGVQYVLNVEQRTARRGEVHYVEASPAESPDGEGNMKWVASTAEATPDGGVALRREVHVRRGAFSDSTATFNVPIADAPSDSEVTTESLGTQMVEGIMAEGTRTTSTIPAGAIGNEQPIETVVERWYSPQLQLLVMSKTNDPRMGESTYRLTNVQLVEPPASLFEVPPDYQVIEGARYQLKVRGVAKEPAER